MSDDKSIESRQLKHQHENHSSEFLLAEYSALRSEILKRTDIQHQLLSLSLIALGTLVTVGLEKSPTLLLVYPILAMFLAASWSQHDIRIWQLGDFIRNRHEPELLGEEQGWEHVHPSSTAGKTVGSRVGLASSGILIGSQGVALVLGLLQTGFPVHDVFIAAVDVLVIAYTAHLLRWNPEAVRASGEA